MDPTQGTSERSALEARYTIWQRLTKPGGREATLPWAELTAKVEAPRSRIETADPADLEAIKADLPLWTFARFAAGVRARDGRRFEHYRSKGTFAESWALALDYDSDPNLDQPRRGNPDLSWDDLARCWGRWRRVVHTTAGHRPGRARYRGFLFLSRPVDADEYGRVARWALRWAADNGAPGLDADMGWREPHRGYFVPVTHDHYRGACLDGEPLDVDAILEDDPEETEELPDEEAEPTVGDWGWLSPDSTWLEEEPPPREYLLHDAGSDGWRRGPGLIPRGKVAILAGAGGVGKTLALCGLALSAVAGVPWLGRFPVGEKGTRRAVLVLGEEDGPELRRRLFYTARAMDLQPHHYNSMSRVLALPGCGLDGLALTQAEEHGQRARTETADRLRAYLEAEAERNGEGWDLIVLDPLSRFAGPDVETDNSAATRLIQVLERFTMLPGSPTVVIAHHLAKHARGANSPADGAVGVRGSSAIVDGARWVGNLEPVFLSGLRQAGHAIFRVSKSNYAAFPDSSLTLTRCDGGGLRAATSSELQRLEELKAELQEKAQARKPRGRKARAAPPEPSGAEIPPPPGV